MPDQLVSLTPSTLLAYSPASTTAVKLAPTSDGSTATIPAEELLIDSGVAIDPASLTDPILLPADSPLIYQNIVSVDKAATIDVTPTNGVYTLTSAPSVTLVPADMANSMPSVVTVHEVSNASAIEGDRLVFTVSLTDTTASPTTVLLTTTNGTAVFDIDYSTNLEASFDGGKTWQGVPAGGEIGVGTGIENFQVRTASLTDNLLEGSETFALNACANGRSVTGTGTIIDKNTAPLVAPKVASVSDPSAIEGERIVFTVNLTDTTTAPTIVSLTTANGTATFDADYSTNLEASFDGGKTWQGVPAGGEIGVGTGVKSFQVRTITLTDNSIEGDETFTLKACANGVSAIGTGTIIDKNIALTIAPKVISVSDSSAIEGDKEIFTVSLSGTTTAPTSVFLSTTNGTAVFDADFSTSLEASFDGGKTWQGVPAGGEIAVGAGVKDFQVRNATLTDNLVEGTEKFALNAYGNGGFATGTGTILDKNVAPKVVSVSDASATEGDKEVFTVGLSDVTTAQTTIQLTLTNGTAIIGADFDPNLEVSFDGGKTWTPVPASGQLTVSVGVKDFQVRNTALTDNLLEGTEKFTLTATGNGGMVTGTGTIVDKNVAPTVISVSNATATEGEKEVFTVGLSAITTAPTIVLLTTANGTAISDADYSTNLEASFDGGKTWQGVPAGGEIAVGVGVKDFQVRTSALSDNLVEGAETFTLKACANGVSVVGTGTILDKNVAPKVISVTDASATEGDKEVFTVGLSDTTTDTTIVKLSLASGTATLGADFDPNLEASFDGGKTWTPVAGDTLTVAPGIKTFQVRTTALNDTLVEPTEKFTLTAAANGTTVTGTGTILDRLVPATIASISNSSTTEGGKEVFTVNLTANSAPTQVKLTLADGNANVGSDYTPALEVSFDGGTTYQPITGDTVTVPGGAANFLVRSSTVDDAIYEPTETYTLTAAANGTQAVGTGTIIDNDPKPQPASILSVGNSSVTEGGKEVFTINLTANNAPTQVKLTLADGTTSGGADYAPALEVSLDGGVTYQPVTGDTVTVPGGTASFLVRNATVDDTNFEPTETYTLTAAANGTQAVGTGTILDNDVAPVIPKVIGVTNTSVPEGEKAIFTIGLSETTNVPTTVKLNLASKTATIGDDFAPALEASFDGGKTWNPVVGDSVTLGAGVKDFQVRTQTIDDTKVEPNETFTLTASANGGAVTGTGTIVDNDKPTTVASITDSTVTEGDKEVFTVTLANPGDTVTTVKLTPVSGTATAGVDFTPDLEVSYNGGTTWTAIKPDGTVDVPANTPNFLVRHSTIDDKLVEPTEKYTLTVSANGTQATGIGTILDNDVAPLPKVISITDASAVEGNLEVFTVGLSDTTTAPTTVKLTLTSGTATIGDDFAPALEASFDGGKTWNPVAGDTVTLGSGIKDFQVRTLAVDDTLVEGTEKFTLTASGSNGGTVTGTGTILDNDVAAPVAPKVISISNPTATEGEKEVFTVGLSGTTTAPTTVKLNLASGTATIGKDFAPTLEASFDGGKTWNPVNGDTLDVGVGIKDFQVRTQALTDNLKEGTETFSLTASGNGGTVTGLGTILDNFKKPINAQLVGTNCINEGNKANYCVNLDRASDTDRYFTLQVDNGSAKRYDGNGAGQDFVWGGAFDIKSTGKVFKDRVPNDNINGNNNRAAVGTGDASWDFTVYNSQGQVNKGNTITVKVAAGQTKSEQFSVQAWQENVTIDQDYFNPNGLNKTNYNEGTENFSIKVVDAGDATITNNNLNVAIKDTSHYTFVSPIAIDLNGDGIKTVSIDRGVKFDLLNTGNAINVGWISSGDGLLAVDNNGNGKIDNRSELFGGGVGEGFAKLATFDSNHDGFVTAQDADFGKLKVWQDKNTNGTTDGNELFSLSDLGIASLKVASQSKFELDAQHNVLGERSSATTTAGKSIDMVDVYFQVNTHNLG